MARKSVYQWPNGYKQHAAILSPNGKSNKSTVWAVWSMIKDWGPDEDGTEPEVVLRAIFYAEDEATITAWMQGAELAIKRLEQEDQLSRREAVAAKVMKTRKMKGLYDEYQRNAGILLTVKERQGVLERTFVAVVQKALKEAELNTESIWFDGERVRVSAQLSSEGRPTGPRKKYIYEYHTAPLHTRYPKDGPHVFHRQEWPTEPIAIYAYRGENEWLARIEMANPSGAAFKYTGGGKTPYQACMVALRWLMIKRLGPEKGGEDGTPLSYNWTKELGIPKEEVK